ncbi:unnamed protein product [Lymnaea stagnalis]|uniref:RING-type domain-containing protein n=1 Tax=Lymnaea stagnalis TaxID=6523 RepID=A0AAV2HQZ7_LYMST
MDADRLASYSSVVWTTYSAILSFIRLAQAGFRYTGDGLAIICEGCEKILDMVAFVESGIMLDPSQIRFHSGACKFVNGAMAGDRRNELDGCHVGVTDGGLNRASPHLPASDRTLSNSHSGGGCVQVATHRDSRCQGLNSSQHATNGSHATSQDVFANNTLQVSEPLREGPTPRMCSGNHSQLPSEARNDVICSDSPEVTSSVFKVLTHPSYPVFISYNKRLESFTNWQHHHIHQPGYLAQAGFFYAGYSDCVRCFQCGLGLRSWKPGDDVYDQHRKHRPSCPFLGTTVNVGTVEGPNRTDGESSGEDDGGIPSTDDITVALLKRESAKLKERLLCKVCLKAPIKDLFLPCGELYACSDCSKLLTHCPACNKLILATSSIYFA